MAKQSLDNTDSIIHTSSISRLTLNYLQHGARGGMYWNVWVWFCSVAPLNGYAETDASCCHLFILNQTAISEALRRIFLAFLIYLSKHYTSDLHPHTHFVWIYLQNQKMHKLLTLTLNLHYLWCDPCLPKGSKQNCLWVDQDCVMNIMNVNSLSAQSVRAIENHIH